MIHYAVTIFLSAFLLFQVQPMIAKIILAWFGGSAAVWTTCMLFFQSGLLLGYLYSDFVIRRLSTRQQAWVHSALLCISLAVLPVIPGERWQPAGGSNPTVAILALLAACVGLPYFLLSTTGPLVQAWYARAHPSRTPYRLFALSNLGSMLALLSYPTLVEPYLRLRPQAEGWSLAYASFALLCGALAWRGARTHPPAEHAAEEEPPPKAGRRLLWLVLPACPSILLLAVTNHLTQDVAAIPFLWVLPLTLYLLSFILTFDARGWYRREVFFPLLAPALCGMGYLQWSEGRSLDLRLTITLWALAFFVCCMVCHGELAHRKPHPRYLTSFYLMISIGGALGGVFVGLVAPYLFFSYLELPIGIGLCALLAVFVLSEEEATPWWKQLTSYGSMAMLAGVVALWIFLGRTVLDSVRDCKLSRRNFYGMLRVRETKEGDEWDHYKTLLHGSINHGEQWTHPDRRREITTYYCADTGLGLAMAMRNKDVPHRVGVLGLGGGTLATYGRKGDYYRFYEINPLVPKIARSEFTYLADCPARIDVVMGDGRLSLEREPSQNFDLLVMDAFSGDSIPVHLVTREAFRTYFRHMTPNGIVAVHISNKYVDLAPVLGRIAEAMGKTTLLVERDESEDGACFGTTWVLMMSWEGLLEEPLFQGVGPPAPLWNSVRVWTDDYSNLFRILKTGN